MTDRGHKFYAAILEILFNSATSIIMADLTDEIAAYEAIRSDLESKYMGRWALVHDRKLIDTYDSFELAAETAVKEFGRGPYLIRQIGSSALTLPASVMYHVHA